MIIHCIWWARNRSIFHNDVIPVFVSISKIFRAIFDAAVFKVGRMVNEYSELRVLRRLQIAGIPHHPPCVFGV